MLNNFGVLIIHHNVVQNLFRNICLIDLTSMVEKHSTKKNVIQKDGSTYCRVPHNKLYNSNLIRIQRYAIYTFFSFL